MGGFFLCMQEAILASAIIYLDESGDLGWKFDAPYRRGGSSRYLTISALCVPTEKKHLPKRAIKKLYQKYSWPVGEEKKWFGMTDDEKSAFASRLETLCCDNPEICLKAIVVKKENVLPHIRKDGNKLYNYMIRLLLLNYMKQFDVVTLVPDPRSIKVESGNSLHDYLQTELWFTEKSITNLLTTPLDSKICLNLQFADMLSGVVQSRHEDNKSAHFNAIVKRLDHKTLFF